MNEPKPIFLFSVKPSGYRESGGVYDPEGIAPTFKENHGEVMRVIEYEKVLRTVKNEKQRPKRNDNGKAL